MDYIGCEGVHIFRVSIVWCLCVAGFRHLEKSLPFFVVFERAKIPIFLTAKQCRSRVSINDFKNNCIFYYIRSMASTQNTRLFASQPVDNKRKAPPLEQTHTRRPRNSSEMQRDMAIPYLSSMLYDRMHQFPYAQQQPSQLIAGNKNSLAIGTSPPCR